VSSTVLSVISDCIIGCTCNSHDRKRCSFRNFVRNGFVSIDLRDCDVDVIFLKYILLILVRRV
jgi:hypothetical protein